MNQFGNAAQQAEGLCWVKDISERLGRPLRVLHIGNIANNAFNNARIQRQYGIDADVLSFDYYHIMATPEWEEASFVDSPGDPLFPDWHRMDLGDYRRPRWFASGPLADCSRYLQAHVENAPEADRLWKRLEYERFIRCSRSLRAQTGLLFRKIGWKLAYERKKLEARVGRGEGRPERTAMSNGALGFSELEQRWQTERPGRAFPANCSDLNYYWERFRHFTSLLPHYDIVQGYAIDGLWPLLAGRAYAGYEHGTLRSLPFEDNSTGRLTALCFGLADQVLVTNIDCLASADRLGLGRSRVLPLPHAFDDQRLRDFAAEHVGLHPPADRLRFFTPARQDWCDGDPNLAKGNDRFLRAAAALAADGLDFEVIAVRWGRHVAESDALAAELGLAKRLRWIEPMQKPDLWRAYLTSHAVIDQFALPAFGGVTFEALALGRRVLNALDVPSAERFFGTAPPLLAASSVLQIETALRQVAEDAEDRASIGARGAAWIEEFHSAPRIMALQMQVYRSLLDEAVAARH